MKYLFVFLLVLAPNAFSSTILSTTIESILVGEVYGNMVFIEISIKPSSEPSCQTNPNYSYVFDPTTEVGKVTMSLLLIAYASGEDVFLNGYDACTIYSGVENLRQIWIK